MKVKCEACGAVYENPTSMICDQCGMRMSRVLPAGEEEEPEYIRCPNCGALNKRDVKICFDCGELIRQKKEIY